MKPPTRNRTGLRSFDRYISDVRITEIYHDSDGYWVELEPGWTAERRGAHDIHEDTVKDTLARIRDIEPCTCDDCRLIGQARIEA